MIEDAPETQFRRGSKTAGPKGTASKPASASDDPGVIVHSPLSLRSASLLVIAVIASLTALRLASAVFVPLVVGVMFSYALTPFVNQMVRLHLRALWLRPYCCWVSWAELARSPTRSATMRLH